MSMEKKNKSTCEKIFEFITISPCFRTIRRISHNPQHSPNFSKPVKPPRSPVNRDGAEVVHIKFDNSSLPTRTAPSAPKKEATAAMIPVEKKPKTPAALSSQHGQGRKTGAKVDREKSNKWGENGEDDFSNYINRAKAKITATTSNVGEGKNTANIGEGKNDDHFSNYINRVKHRIRTMPSFVGGTGRSDSIK